MAEPGKVISLIGGKYSINGERTRSYSQTMAQYNRILNRFSDIYENGAYDESNAARERRVDEIMNRYADNIENSRAFRSAVAAYRRGENVNPDNVLVPYSVYARKNNRR